MYRSGDRGRWLPDGAIEFLGRNDFQVKIRGFRIELGEIEASLAEHAEVREAVVIAREDARGDKRLVAYYTSAETEQPVEAGRLREHLLARLPEYMAPAAYVHLPGGLPLTSNGKLDRRALPEPGGDAYATRGYEEPQGETETKLAQIWAEALKLERVGRRDNFFELGGHSLLVVTMIERLRGAGYKADVKAIFASPTLAALAATVEEDAATVEIPENRIPPGCQAITPEMLPLVALTQAEIDRIVASVPHGAANIQDIYPLAPLQEGILFHHLMDGERDPYLQGMQLGFDRRERLDGYVRALQAVIDRHDILRTGVQWEGISEPVQVVYREARLPMEEVELDAGSGDAAERLYERFHPRRFRMDVRQAPLLRLYIAYDAARERWLMMLLLHHLAVDHIAFEAMQSEVEAHLLGQEALLPPPLPFRNLVFQTQMERTSEGGVEYESA
jgi:aryl carrier-like protein